MTCILCRGASSALMAIMVLIGSTLFGTEASGSPSQVVSRLEISGTIREHTGAVFNGDVYVSAEQTHEDDSAGVSIAATLGGSVTVDSTGAFVFVSSSNLSGFVATRASGIRIVPQQAGGGYAAGAVAYLSAIDARNIELQKRMAPTATPGQYRIALGTVQFALAPVVATVTVNAGSASLAQLRVTAGDDSHSGGPSLTVPTGQPISMFSWNAARMWSATATADPSLESQRVTFARGGTVVLSCVELTDLTVLVDATAIPDMAYAALFEQSTYIPFQPLAGSDNTSEAGHRIQACDRNTGLLPAGRARTFTRVPPGNYTLEVWGDAGLFAGVAERTLQVSVPYGGVLNVN